jgi:hypothetical protein
VPLPYKEARPKAVRKKVKWQQILNGITGMMSLSAVPSNNLPWLDQSRQIS